MSVSSPFIHRPVATSLLGVAILLCGLLGFWRLSVSPLPQVDFPTIQITTQLAGANPDTVAALITAPLERQFGQIPALDSMASQSSFGLSQITLQFELDRDIDAAAQDVQSAINAAAANLPRNLPYPPTYAKINPADTPIMTLALTSQTAPLRMLSDLADTMIGPRLSEVTGVGHVGVEGGIRPAVRIQVDLARLASYRIGLEDLRTVIVGANVASPKGSLDGAQQAYTIAANDQIGSARAYEGVVIANRNGANVLLRDVATVVDGLENTRVGGWFQGQPAVILDVQRQPGANIVATADLIARELPRLRRALPAGVTLQVVHDRTDTIRASIADVEFTLVLSAILVILVVLVFLRSVRATIIAGVALPLSIIATFAVMWLAGFSLDNLSLMALTIGTGFIVDDAIVMIENVARHSEEGDDPLTAALKGAREIGFTVISLTVSLIAVFIPLLFMTGLVGRMFREFALTLSVAVIVSAVISLTLTPMMCSLILGRIPDKPQNAFQRLTDWPLSAMARGYDLSLGWALRHRRFMLALTAGTLALTAALYAVMPKGFLPEQDTGLITMVLETAPDASFAEISRIQARVTEELRQEPEIETVVSVLGIGPLNATSNVGRITVSLKAHDARSASAASVAEAIRAIETRVPGVHLYVQPVQDIQIATRSSRSQYQYTLIGADPAEVSLWSGRLLDELRRDPTFRNAASETQEGGLRAQVTIDREKAGRFGISMQQVDDTLNDAFGQRQISTIYAQSNQYRVILEAEPRYQTDPRVLDTLYIQSPGGAQVPLSAFATLERTTAPLSIAHQDQFPAATLSFDLGRDSSLGAAVEAVKAIEERIGMPSTVVGAFGADAAEFNRALAGEVWLILAAVVTIYIVLGMLYESFIHPITILSTLPSAGVGALLALALTGHDLSIVALIGIILLMGIVKKNAIMMIDFAIEAERERGLSSSEAIIEACRLRFRPIMMTTLAALLGAVPLALAHGAGAELRVPLGDTIIGGLLLSQLLTLYTTPVIFLMLDRFGRKTRPAERPSGERLSQAAE
jgi:multidrug efflux pump